MWIKSVDKIQEFKSSLTDNTIGVYKITLDDEVERVFTVNGNQVKLIQHGIGGTDLLLVTEELRGKILRELDTDY